MQIINIGGNAGPLPGAPSAGMYTGSFGVGERRFIPVSTDFVVPEGVTRVRVRLWGGCGVNYSQYYGGAGGFCLKVCDVTPGEIIPVTVSNTYSGTSSFGGYCSAYGGISATPATNGNRPGGAAIGGDINCNGSVGFSNKSYQSVGNVSGHYASPRYASLVELDAFGMVDADSWVYMGNGRGMAVVEW